MKIEHSENFRANVVQQIQHHLFGNSQINKISQNIEIGIFNYAIHQANEYKIVKKWNNPLFVQLYTDRLRSIYFNLSNESLAEAIRTERISCEQLATMTHQDMMPEKWQGIMDRLRKKEESKRNVKIEAMTDAYKCRKCGSRKVTYVEVQLRSADESANLLCSCVDCGTKWKL